MADISTPQFQLSAAGVIAALGPQPSWGAVAAAIVQYFPGAQHAQYFAPTSPFPAFLIFSIGDSTVLCSYGVFSWPSAAAVFGNGLASLASSGSWSTSTINLAAANRLLAGLRAYGFPSSRNLLLCGHSFGGASVSTLAAMLLDSGFTPAIQVLTMGSPRAGDLRLAARLSAVYSVRLMTDTDPICLFPPHWDDDFFLVALAPFPVAYTWSQYAHTAGGLVITPSGTLRTSELPTNVGFSPSASIAASAVGPGGVLAPGHVIGAYMTALMSLVARESSVIPGGSTSELATSLTSSEQAAAQRRAALYPLGLSEDLTVAYIPPQYAASVTTIKGPPKTYHVTWMGNVVADVPTKSNAHTIAKNLNRFLRRLLQDNKLFYQVVFDSALDSWITTAASGSSGITPPLVVG